MAYLKRRSGKLNPFHVCWWVWQVGFLMVAAFLVHDGYMAVEGHVMAAGMSSAPHAGMTVEHEAHAEHVETATGIDTVDLVVTDSPNAPAGIPICATARPAIIVNRDEVRQIEPRHQYSAVISSEDMSYARRSAWTTAILERDPPPSRAPDVQRAMFQVYLI